MLLDQTNPTILKYTGSKISKVKFLLEDEENSDHFVSGTWDGGQNNAIGLWRISNKDVDPEINEINRLNMEADVNDIFAISSVQIVTGLSNGVVKILDCDTSTDNAQVIPNQVYNNVHRNAASTAIYVLNSEIFSGSDTGEIVRIVPGSTSKPISILSHDLTGVRCMAECGSFLLSGHFSGQINLWDLRASTGNQSPNSSAAMTILGKIPTFSKAVTMLNDAVTSLTSHPAQPNVVAFGTHSGSVSFIDIRRPDQELPNLFKICMDTVNQVKFHPNFTNNFFSSSDSALIHWDASTLSQTDTNPAPQMYYDNNIWLSGKVWNNVQLKAIVEENVRFINTFDITRYSIVVGSNTTHLLYMNNLNVC